ncbi:MAG: YoaK family protein [Lachnospiraceae bacterium]
MCLIGGFLGGFSILNNCDLFGSAQTANLISITLMIAGRNREDFLLRIIATLLYLLGVSITVILPHKIKKINMKLVSLIFTTIGLFILYYIPEDTPNIIALYPIFFIMSVQWCCFKGADGFTSSCIFSTNNFRQCTAAMTEYFVTKDNEALRKGKFFGNVLLFFHLGVVCSYMACSFFEQNGILLCLIPVASAVSFVHIEDIIKNNEKASRNKKQQLKLKQSFAQQQQ